MKLEQTKIGDAKVIVDILPKGKCIPNTGIKPTSITIHQTGNIGASAKANHNYMKNINKSGERIASWHFTVDDVNIYQAIDTNKKAYHAGCTSGNNTSIGIEICMFNNASKQIKAYKNAIALVKVLMNEYSFNINKVKRHYDWTKKNCPQWLISGKYGYNWSWFKTQLKGATSYLVKINVDELNVREGCGVSYPIKAVVKQGEVYTITETKGSWGKLKSGVGWINLNYTIKP